MNSEIAKENYKLYVVPIRSSIVPEMKLDQPNECIYNLYILIFVKSRSRMEIKPNQTCSVSTIMNHESGMNDFLFAKLNVASVVQYYKLYLLYLAVNSFLL
jgi:hypothetical protein